MDNERLIILGTGISGLVAASALSQYFNEVIIIDKDEVGGENVRPGAAQGAHLHVLLKEGQSILFKYFPEIRAKLLERSCKEVDWSKDTVWESHLGKFPQYYSNIKTISMSRRILESLITVETEKKNNIKFIKDFVIDYKDGKIITRNHGTLIGDLTIVALGTFNKIKSNLRIVKNIDINLSYQSVIFKAEELNLNEEVQYYYQSSPDGESLGGVICPIEDDKYIATIIEYGKGIGKDFKEYESFLNRAREIPSGNFYNIIKDARPISPVSIYLKKKMILSTPLTDDDKLIYIGDSLVSLNPSFGQGMTVALQQIKTLENLFKYGEYSSKKFNFKCREIIRRPFFLAYIGSKASGPLKVILDSYLSFAIKSKFLHYRFLKQLHLLTSRSRYD